jgi:ADP-heptose:LPS heptosyltransferase
MSKILQKIFSLKNSSDNSHKILTIMGISFKFKQKIKNAVAIIGAKGIGDYILQRAYFKCIRDKYKNQKIIFFLKNNQKSLLYKLDNEFFDEIVFYESTEKPKYCSNLKNIIDKHQYDVCIYLPALKFDNPKHGEYLSYNLVNIINAKTTYASVFCNENTNLQRIKHLKKYKKLYPITQKITEPQRYKEFMEFCLRKDVKVLNPQIPVALDFSKKIIAISPMTDVIRRQYDVDNWIKIVDYILKNTDSSIQIAFLGSFSDIKSIDTLCSLVQQKERCINLAGMFESAFLPTFLKNCEILIAPETGTVHCAYAVGLKTICLCNGTFYGRYQPYDKYITYIYPEKVQNAIENNDSELLNKLYFDYLFETSEINLNKVLDIIEKHLKEMR